MHTILQTFPDAPITALFVWLPMLPQDSAAAAAEAARTYDDPRARHFYDPQRVTGQAIASVLGGAGRVAWDTYLVYPAGARWDRAVPAPEVWTHQLEGSAWADAAHYRSDEALIAALHSAMRRLIGGDGTPT